MADLKQTIDRLADEAMTKIYPLSTLGTQREAFRHVAREAVRAALTEPDQAMIEAGQSYDGDHTAICVWNDMAETRLKGLE